jgi:hypothetical protein
MATLKKTSTEGRAELLVGHAASSCATLSGVHHTDSSATQATTGRREAAPRSTYTAAARVETKCAQKRKTAHITLHVCRSHPVLCRFCPNNSGHSLQGWGGHHNGAGHHPTEQTEQPPRLRCTRVRLIAPARVAVVACYLDCCVRSLQESIYVRLGMSPNLLFVTTRPLGGLVSYVQTCKLGRTEKL